MAGQNKGRGGSRTEYPEVHVMRLLTRGYYNRIAAFTLNELNDVHSPNILEFVASGLYASTTILPGDVIRVYQPQETTSVYTLYHEPGTGPSNYYINGMPFSTKFTFPTASLSSTDRSRPLLIVQLSKSVANVQHM